MKISNKDKIGIVEDTDPEHDAVAFCRICLRNFSIKAPLGPRLDYNERDSEKWRQCTHCRRIFPIYEIKHEGKLVGLLEPESNPFKSTGEVIGLDNKKFDKTERRKKEIQDRIRNERDPEIRALLKQGFDVTFMDDNTNEQQ